MAKKPKKSKPLLQHHRHSGKVLPRHHTSWPFVALLLLMLGVLMFQITFPAGAADVTVTATADGPLPPSPATITSPVNGQEFSKIPITVTGTCPEPYLVKLYRNQVFSGSARCQPDGTFSIVTDLFAGENELESRIYNYADQEGPSSSPITVMYYPPEPTYSDPNGSVLPPGSTPGSSPSGGPGQSLENPFFLMTDKFYKANMDKQRIDWTFTIVGGNKPYDISVDWGDGQKSKLENLIDKKFSVSHEYVKGTKTPEYFPMKVSVGDTYKRKAMLQVFNILSYSNISGYGSSLPTGGTGFTDNESLLQQMRYVWLAYATITLMAISFWLGQHLRLVPVRQRAWIHKSKFPTLRLKH